MAEIRDGVNCGSSCGSSCYGRGGSEGRYTGTAQCFGCGFRCADSGGCSGTCTGTCSGVCGGCGSSCSGSCGGDCKGTCEGKCLSTCSGACLESCGGLCYGHCYTVCTGNCSHLCNTTCSNDEATAAFGNLNLLKDKLTLEDYGIYSTHPSNDGIILNYLDSEDMYNIIDIMREEVNRRKLHSDKDGNPIGAKESILDYETLNSDKLNSEQIKLINLIKSINNKELSQVIVTSDEIGTVNTLLNHLNKSIVTSEFTKNSSINRAIGVTLIKKLLDSYKETVIINSISNSRGKLQD